MKKLITSILCILSVCSIAACGNKNTDNGKNEIPNPFVDCNSLEDAAKIAGFDFVVPDTIGKFTDRTIQAIDKDVIQVIYNNGDNSVYIRKGIGSDDISGDYNNYSETNTVMVGNLQVTVKGENGTVSVATWTDNGFTFAMGVQNIPMTNSEITTLIEGVH